MRRLLHDDVCSAARVLRRCPPDQRARLCERMIAEAEAADAYMKRFGRVHPLWGNGSLSAAARKRMLAPDAGFSDPEHCLCFDLVLQRLIRRAEENGARSTS